MPDYSKGKIYTIRCRTDNTLIYVGSTIQPLSVRIGGHKRRCNIDKYQNILIYKTINNKWDNWYIELYEDYPCENKEQLCKREGEIIRKIGTLNSRIEGRNQIEYYQDNKEIITEKKKIYNEINKEKISKVMKIYCEEHKERIAEVKKIYREEHKEIILKKSGERINCECGCMIRRSDISTHKKTLKHIKLLNSLNIN
jgi:hypothetical protein